MMVNAAVEPGPTRTDRRRRDVLCVRPRPTFPFMCTARSALLSPPCRARLLSRAGFACGQHANRSPVAHCKLGNSLVAYQCSAVQAYGIPYILQILAYRGVHSAVAGRYRFLACSAPCASSLLLLALMPKNEPCGVRVWGGSLVCCAYCPLRSSYPQPEMKLHIPYMDLPTFSIVPCFLQHVLVVMYAFASFRAYCPLHVQ